MSADVGNFFAVDRRTWLLACSLGVNAAIAYLVLACFSNKANRITRASAHAIHRYSGIAKSRSRAPIEHLIHSGVVQCKRRGRKPIYDLLPWAEIRKGRTDNFQHSILFRDEAQNCAAEGIELDLGKASQWTYVPKTLVMGLPGTSPPLSKLRESREVRLVQLLIDLYDAQNLRDDGGVSRSVLASEYERPLCVVGGEYNVAGFRKPHAVVLRSRAAARFGMDGNWQRRFLVSIGLLTRLGFVEHVPVLFESSALDAEPIHALGTYRSDPRGKNLADAAHRAAHAILSQEKRDQAKRDGLLLAVTEMHIRDPHLASIFYMTHPAQTSLTQEWLQDRRDRDEAFLSHYETIAQRQERNLRLVG